MTNNMFVAIHVVFYTFLFVNSNLASEPTAVVETSPDDSTCLRCICVAMSGCNTNLKCDNDVCGAFRITKPYWIDGDTPTVPGELPTDSCAYENCTNNLDCATRTVINYLKRTQQVMRDCNKDQVIDCHDYAAIHKYGGYGGCYDPKNVNTNEYAIFMQALDDCLCDKIKA